MQQIGSQEDVYERPATPFVAGFIGRSNMLPGTLAANGIEVAAGGAVLRLAGRYDGAGPCTLALRPERLSLGPPDAADPGSVRGTIELALYLGAVREHLVRIGPDLRVVVRDQTGGAARLHAIGEAVALRWDSAAERLFDAGAAPLPYTVTSQAHARMPSDV